jgi:hypothetical protein
MKLIKRIPELKEMPPTFCVDRYSESTARDLLREVIIKAREVIEVVSEAYKEEWTNKPSISVRAVFGHWLVKAARHFLAAIILCEERDLSVVAGVHHRQMFELFIQIRYYASATLEGKEIFAEKISALGCVEYLEKLDVVKDNDHMKGAYDEISEILTHHNQDIVSEIRKERKNRIYDWFGCSFSQLAKDVSREGENLRGAYQIISADIHGAWDLALGVNNPEPGVLDFRGYPNKATMYIRAADLLDQITTLYMNLWNEIAESVGAQGVYYSVES